MRLLLPFLLLFSLQLAGAQSTIEIPALTSPVMDLAGFLNEAEKKDLGDFAYEINANNGPQITILTVPNLQGNEIEEYSIRVADKWKLGTKERDNGLLVVIAKEERRMRIEVGQGLEGDITDYDTAKYTRQVFPEYFRRGEFHAALRLFMEDVAQRFNIKASDSAPRMIRRTPKAVRIPGGEMLIIAIIGILAFGSLIFRGRPFARGLFTGVGFTGTSLLLGIPAGMMIVIFFIGLVLGLVGIGNLLTAIALSGGRGGRGGFGGGGFGGGGGGWGGGGGGFSGGGSSGSW